MVLKGDMENTRLAVIYSIKYENYENSSKQRHFVSDSKCLMW